MQNQTFKTPQKNTENNHTPIKLSKNIPTTKSLNEIIKLLSKYISEIIPEISQEKQEKINSYFNKIFQIIKIISSEKKNLITKYDSILRLSEEKIRVLYSDLFNLKIKNTFLENNIDILLKKEKEYRLVKEKTGILVENGVVIHNDRKENEIFILRTENSNLKNVIKQKDTEINELNDKLTKKQNNFDKKISQLNFKIEQLRYRLRTKNNQTKGNSSSNLNFNTNNEQNNSINNKLNFTINNSLNKDNVNKIIINGIINNNNNNNESCFNRNGNNSNMNLIKKKYDSILLNQKKNIRKILTNTDTKYISSLIHCQSMGYLNLKKNTHNNSKSKNKYKSTNKTFNLSKNQNINSLHNLNLSNLNVSPIHNKKLICFSPLNDELVNKLNFESKHKARSKNNSKSKKKSEKTKINSNNITVNNIINKNNNNSTRSLIKSKNTSSMNSMKGIKVIYNSKTKFKYLNKKSEIQDKTKKILKDINLTHNTSLNYSRIPISNNNNTSRSKINTKRSYSKKSCEEKENEGNNKNSKKDLIMNISGKENVLVNKTSISSIRRKNTVSTSNNSFYSKNILNI